MAFELTSIMLSNQYRNAYDALIYVRIPLRSLFGVGMFRLLGGSKVNAFFYDNAKWAYVIVGTLFGLWADAVVVWCIWQVTEPGSMWNALVRYWSWA